MTRPRNSITCLALTMILLVSQIVGIILTVGVQLTTVVEANQRDSDGGLLANKQARSIFVDKNSLAPLENGTASAPFRTITRGLEHARSLRFGSSTDGNRARSGVITLNVAASPTPYVGSFEPAVFDPSSPTYDPSKEKLPLLINIPNLKIQGGTTLVKDDDGLPESVVPGTETIIHADRPQGSKQYMVLITRTHPLEDPETEMAGDNVTITGFWLQAEPTRQLPAALIGVDGVMDFVVRENVLTNGGNGVWTRLSSGRIVDNLAVNNAVGFYLTAGSNNFPARLNVETNRASGNVDPGNGIYLVGSGDTGNRRVDLDFGANKFRRISLETVYDRELHPDEVPDTLYARVVGNECNGNRLQPIGIRVVGYLQDPYSAVAGQDETANITAIFRNNVSRSNLLYGLVVDAGQIPLGDRRIVQMHLSFEDTILEDNGLGPALFSLWRYAGSIGGPFSAPNPTFAHDSTIEACGDVTQFHYDNRQDPDPPTNPAPTNNRLTVNGLELSGLCTGTCSQEVPRVRRCRDRRFGWE